MPEARTDGLLIHTGQVRIKGKAGALVIINDGVITASGGIAATTGLTITTGGLTVTAGASVLAGTVRLSGLGARVAGDVYVIMDASGNLHKSAIGPAS